MRDPARRTDVSDVIKHVPLRDDGAWYLSLGGELRERYEYFHNASWGQGPQDETGYLLQRCMLHADISSFTECPLSDMVGDGRDFSFYFLVTGCSDEERALLIARDAFSRRVTLIDNMLAPARK